ncbi:MAG TPA: succinate CoA transferase [Pseudogracilibacillus sp.]|nr:succinate CoA transferase [Pseudogracilibacillus sp.]
MQRKLQEKIRNHDFFDKIISVEEAVTKIEDGMTIGISGFTVFGEPKSFMKSLAKYANERKFKVNLLTGASSAPYADELMAEKDALYFRAPYQGNRKLRNKINNGEIRYIDQHLSQVGDEVRKGSYGKIDYAVIEAIAITEDGKIIPSGSLGNTAVFAKYAENIIIELNTLLPKDLEEIHDVYLLEEFRERTEVPVYQASDRIGDKGVTIDFNKVNGIIIADEPNVPSPLAEPTEETQSIANHLIDFLSDQVEQGHLPISLRPLQSGVGSVANAVLKGMIDAPFKDLEVYSEVIQDGVLDLIDAGVVKMASATSLTLSEKRLKTLGEDIKKYKDHIVLRPQEISNHPEVIRRLGLISVNTALEVDIYGNVNSTHVNGTKMMNGIGGSGDFARNAGITVFVTTSVAKDGDISSVVPFVPHVDHTEHDVDVIVTDQGYADLRGLTPVERAEEIINNCAHPMYREQLQAYFDEAKISVGGQTPHILEKALSWHQRAMDTGSMLKRELVEQ